MANDVTLSIVLDQTQLNTGLAEAMVKIDAAVKAAKEARRKIMQDISQATGAISTMMTSYSQIMNLLGMQADAFYAALIGMTLSTISMLISIASALAATVVGIPASVVIMGVAASVNLLVLGKLIGEKARTSGIFNNISTGLQYGTYGAGGTSPRGPTGGSF